jgi:hypothetical protein
VSKDSSLVQAGGFEPSGCDLKADLETEYQSSIFCTPRSAAANSKMRFCSARSIFTDLGFFSVRGASTGAKVCEMTQIKNMLSNKVLLKRIYRQRIKLNFAELQSDGEDNFKQNGVLTNHVSYELGKGCAVSFGS